MDIFGKLNKLKDMSGKMAIEKGRAGGQEPAHGTPDDYGLRGAKTNYPLNSIGGRRMAGAGLSGALAGELATHLVEPARKAIQPAFNSLISEAFYLGNDSPKIASR